ncbi:MAG: sugar ABC transporter permease [Magnetospirillum sp.]|jgi:multiple sugar transport system permease protein|nr:sugar ABC transporter permease [Magnetospirillum sp.]
MHTTPRGFLVFALLPAFFFLACFYVYPSVFNIQTSLTDLGIFTLRRGGDWIGVENYVELLTSPDFRRVLFNTVVWLTLAGVTVRIVLGLALAFLLNSRTLRKWRLTTAARLLLIVPWATPPVVAIIVWRWMLDPRVGSINAALTATGVVDQAIPFLSDANWVWPAILLIITWNTLPLVTLTFLASLQSLSAELVEAAEIDGAGPLQLLRYIYLPHLKPAIIVMVLMSTFWTFNNFVYVWLTTGAGPGLYTNVMATEIYIKGFIDGRLGYSAATGVVMATVMTLFGLVYLRVIAKRELVEESK